MPRPIVVTGCSGFVGANLAAACQAAGRQVVGVDSPAAADWRAGSLPDLELVRLDLCDEDAVRAFIHDVQPAAIFNCAAYGAYAVQSDARRIYQVNLLAVRHLLQAVRGASGFRAFVQAGSSSEYGFNCTAPREDAPTLPDSDYAVSKVGATALVQLYGRKHGVPAWVLRLYSIYGPFEDPSRLIPRLLLEARAGRLPPLADPRTSRDFVYIDDVTRAFQAVADRAPQLAPGDVFNIGTGQRTTLADLTALARATFGVAAEPQWSTMPDRGWDHGDWYADARKADAVLGWRATTGLREGLRATMRWIEAHPALVAEGQRLTVLAGPP